MDNFQTWFVSAALLDVTVVSQEIQIRVIVVKLTL
jgi:hypothetical protein